MHEVKKLIKIMNKGMVLTSRGLARAPITHPYFENVNSIMILIARYNAEVVEVLKDGTEIPLTLQNFNTDNGVVSKTTTESVESTTVETTVVKEEVPAEATPFINRNMSRKERKRLEAERARAELESKKLEEAKVETIEAPVENIEETTEEHTNVESEATPVEDMPLE